MEEGGVSLGRDALLHTSFVIKASCNETRWAGVLLGSLASVTSAVLMGWGCCRDPTWGPPLSGSPEAFSERRAPGPRPEAHTARPVALD